MHTTSAFGIKGIFEIEQQTVGDFITATGERKREYGMSEGGPASIRIHICIIGCIAL